MPSETIPVCLCGAPLLWTFAFRATEFYCLDCGRRYGMFGVDRVPATTPGLAARLAEATAIFEPLAAALVVRGSRLLGSCAACDAGEEHAKHATAEEWAADRAARDRLTELALRDA